MNWKKIVLSCTAGNVLELYNFILFAYFSDVLSKLFFPSTDHYAGLMMTFGVFATGCLMRPFGSLFFGYIGDKFGRKKTLVISITVITIATTLIGLLPTYFEIGIYASLLLLLCRLAQGFSMSGEEVGAALLLSEIMPKNRQGLAGSIVLGSVYIGLLIGSIVALVLTLMISEENLLAWGWRIPFLLSFIFGVISISIRMKQVESVEFLKASKDNLLLKNPIIKTITNNWRDVINGILAWAVLASPLYLFAVYIPNKFTTFFGYTTSMLICSFSFILTAISVVLVGLWVDKVGFLKPIFLSCVGLIVFSYPIFVLLSFNTVLSALLAEFLLLILISLSAGSLMTMLVHSFPVNIRFSGVALSFNLGMTIFGSSAPLLAVYITKITGSDTAPFVCLIIASFLTLFSLLHYYKKAKIVSFYNKSILTEG